MFKSLFKKNKTEEILDEKTSELQDSHAHNFQLFILFCLSKYGIDYNCERKEHLKHDIESNKEYQDLSELIGYNELFQLVLLEQLDIYINSNKVPNKPEFINYFISNFHHIQISKLVTEPIKTANTNLLTAYNKIVECVNRIQAWQDNENLRVKVESDFSNSRNHTATIFQCSTPFCTISLGCDQIGRYNILYSVDFRIKEMIGNNFASILIRRIYQFTPEMDYFVNIGSLHNNCVAIFEENLALSENDKSHSVVHKERVDKSSLIGFLGES